MRKQAERRFPSTRLRCPAWATLFVILVAFLTACGGAGSTSGGATSVCALVKPADEAVLSGKGPYVGRESALASAVRKASIPKPGSADPQDVAFLQRMRSETAHDLDAVAKVPKGDSEALDTAKGAVEDDLAAISGNGLCAEPGTGKEQAAPISTAHGSSGPLGQSSAAVQGSGTGATTTISPGQSVTTIPVRPATTAGGLNTSPPVSVARADTGPDSFVSPTGNIGCRMSQTSIRCDVREHDWQPPPKPATCNLDWGSYLGVIGQEPGAFRCVGDTAIAVTTVLPYGSVSRRGPFECRSEATGMTCLNLDTGHGISVSRGEYKLS